MRRLQGIAEWHPCAVAPGMIDASEAVRQIVAPAAICRRCSDYGITGGAFRPLAPEEVKSHLSLVSQCLH